MKRIYKYPLTMAFVETIRMPVSRKTLAALIQHGGIVLYAEVDDTHAPVDTKVYCIPTGANVPPDAIYVSTLMLVGGNYVLHVYIESEDEL